jgi:hypothetical protein
MAYEKQTWENLPSQTTPINADRLTHIEDGVFNAAATADTAASNASSAISGLADKVDKVEGKGLSTNDFTDALKTKLDNVEAGAEVNVQSDWNQSDNSADDYIKNKPTLGTAAYKNSTSVVTDSTDVVESGAVKSTIGWGNKNLANFIDGKSISIDGTVVDHPSRIATVEPITIKTGLSYKYVNTIAGVDTKGIYAVWNGNTLVRREANVASDTILDTSGGDKLYVCAYASEAITVDSAKVMVIYADETNLTYEPYHASVSDSLAEKCDNSVIAPVENGSTASQAYAVGEHFIRDGAFCTCKQAISQGGSFTLNTNYTSGDVADELNRSSGTIGNTNCNFRYVVRNHTVFLYRNNVTSINKNTSITLGQIPTELKPPSTVANYVYETSSGNSASITIDSNTGNVIIWSSQDNYILPITLMYMI